MIMPPIRVVGLVVRPLGSRPEPQVPVEVCRYGLPLRRAGGAAVALVTPDVGLANRADRAALHELDGPPEVAEGVGVGAVLRRHLVLRGQLRDRARLPDGVGE